MLESMTGVQLYAHLPVRQSDQKVFIADVSKLLLLSSWQHKVSCENGVGCMLDWVSQGV
jgi:CDP-paratose 2-epimerase